MMAWKMAQMTVLMKAEKMVERKVDCWALTTAVQMVDCSAQKKAQMMVIHSVVSSAQKKVDLMARMMVIHSVVSSAQKKAETKAESLVLMRAQMMVIPKECYSVVKKWMDLDSAEQKVRMR
jgi:hypothetical protein